MKKTFRVMPDGRWPDMIEVEVGGQFNYIRKQDILVVGVRKIGKDSFEVGLGTGAGRIDFDVEITETQKDYLINWWYDQAPLVKMDIA